MQFDMALSPVLRAVVSASSQADRVARPLVLYEDYSRVDVHDVFDPHSPFTPQSGTWGILGLIELGERPGDFVFFVTFGQKQGYHEFDEGITTEGVFRWQSQPVKTIPISACGG